MAVDPVRGEQAEPVAERAGGAAPIGTIRISWGTCKADLPADIPLAVRAFLLYAAVMHRRGKGPFGDQVNTA